MAQHTRTFVTLAAAALLGGALTAWAAPSSLDARVDALVARFAPEAIQIRHLLHQNPELSNRETKTAALVAEKLRALGLEPRTEIAHTGVVAVLKGGKPGPFIAVRADMDALPVTEDTDLPFKSTVRSTYLGQDVGVAHACGHDIHVAIQLGTSRTTVVKLIADLGLPRATDFDRDAIEAARARAGGDLDAAARQLRVSPHALKKRLALLNLGGRRPPDDDPDA